MSEAGDAGGWRRLSQSEGCEVRSRRWPSRGGAEGKGAQCARQVGYGCQRQRAEKGGELVGLTWVARGFVAGLEPVMFRGWAGSLGGFWPKLVSGFW